MCLCRCVCKGDKCAGVQGEEEEEEDGVSSSVCALQRRQGRQVKAITPGLNDIRHGPTCPDSKA